MARARPADETVPRGRNTARLFVEQPHIAWVVLAATVIWGVFGYLNMPKRKDPEIMIRVAVAVCTWPGASAEKVEQLVTRKLEEKIAGNANVERILALSRGSVSVVHIILEEGLKDVGKQFDDIKLKLDGIQDLPQGAGPIVFYKDFGDVEALMLTVASPRASPIEIALRARSVQRAIEESRRGAAGERATLVTCFPQALAPRSLERTQQALARHLEEKRLASDVRFIARPGFVGLDAAVSADDARLREEARAFLSERLRLADLHPDVWEPAVVRGLADVERRLVEVAGPRYTYRELDDFTDLIKRTLQSVPLVAKVGRTGVLPEAVYLSYSQERLASYGIPPAALQTVFAGRNIVIPGGVLEAQGRNLPIDPTGEFRDEKEIGDVVVSASTRGSPVYLRDVVEVTREYQSPRRFLNFHSWRDADGGWRRERAITVGVQMRRGEQIARFGEEVDRALAEVRRLLPDDLVIARTSDQPLQVEENVGLFMRSLYEAIALVVLVALIGFWEWRSAILVALSIPLTLAMTFGMMHLLGIDVQQVSIASLIIALGLLIDDPIVAGDAIKREIDAGRPPDVGAWLGPTKLASAILFATITNIVAYLPLLLVKGDIGAFIYSMPVVLTCSLVASRIVSMTFVPLLGRYLLRRSRSPEGGGWMGRGYRRLGGWAIDHRKGVLVIALGFLLVGSVLLLRIRPSFFPKDLSYLFYIDVRLPEDAPLASTIEAAARVEEVVRRTSEEFGRHHPGDRGPREVLQSMTTFVGGGGPRFWFSIIPEQEQLNYAQVVVQVKDKRDTNALVAPLQRALSAGVVGAIVDVRQLETASPVGIPVSVRLSGEDIPTLRRLAAEVGALLRARPDMERVRDDWGADSLVAHLAIDADRANLAGLSNLDVAVSSVTGVSGLKVTTLREKDRQIPVVARLRPEERGRLEDLQNLYVFSTQTTQKVPLRQVSTIDYRLQTEKIQRRNQFRTLTVAGYPTDGVLPSEVLAGVRPQLMAIRDRLPPGYRLAIGGEEEEQRKGFRQLSMVMLASVILIFLSLTVEFRHAVKPLIVFAAIPFGMVGALGALTLMGSPFGFMAFLGIASLVGVIVSHVIVLFDYIETAREAGRPPREALLEAGAIRLRPVMITVAATVLGLIPLALHGGPLWEPLCYAQIGGLTLATGITLVLVPVLYAVLIDIGLVGWPRGGEGQGASRPEPAAGDAALQQEPSAER